MDNRSQNDLHAYPGAFEFIWASYELIQAASLLVYTIWFPCDGYFVRGKSTEGSCLKMIWDWDPQLRLGFPLDLSHSESPPLLHRVAVPHGHHSISKSSLRSENMGSC